jgi:hypothetical protein
VTRRYAYSGDRCAVATVREMLDYQIAHGSTPAGWAWPRVPFPTSSAGDRPYLRAALAGAQALAGHVRSGDAPRNGV